MPAADQTPLTEAERETLFAPVADAPRIALAVSGGADSLALLDTIDRWRRRPDRPAVVVFTVDHRLRPESAAEAASVADVVRTRGLPVRVLVSTDPRPVANVEAVARERRYRLLTEAAGAAGATHLLTAHHRDDQAETVLMRLKSGSGVFGLAGMRRMVDSGALTVFRPFLDVPRTRLAATTAAAGLTPIDDPMNRDRRFLRVRIREAMPALKRAGLGAADLAEAAERFAAAAVAIDGAVDALIAEAVTVDRYATARVLQDAYADAPEAVRLRLLARMLMAVGGADYPPRYRRLQALDASLVDGPRRRTLGGVVIDPHRGALRFYREFGRQGLPHVPARSVSTALWDRRFRVAVAADMPPDVSIGPVGLQASSRERVRRPEGLPAAMVSVQPGIWQRDRLIGAPTLSDRGRTPEDWSVVATEVVSDRIAKPPLFPVFDR
ncbi:tRNA lysidine(34) synthetase TilS [Bauldia sp.]|uniref:tRNA lysidine(34) synthetase TilS n=1 Tax=Bauldia sp. TaxID=2575872 RepID=UPI003BAA80BB